MYGIMLEGGKQIRIKYRREEKLLFAAFYTGKVVKLLCGRGTSSRWRTSGRRISEHFKLHTNLYPFFPYFLPLKWELVLLYTILSGPFHWRNDKKNLLGWHGRPLEDAIYYSENTFDFQTHWQRISGCAFSAHIPVIVLLYKLREEMTKCKKINVFVVSGLYQNISVVCKRL